MSVGTTGDRQAAGAVGERYVDDDAGYGWVVFAGVLLLVVGSLNCIYGIAAIDDSKFFVNGSKYVFSDLNTWGWIVLALGVAQLLVGFGIFAKNQFARWVGVGVLAMNAVAQMLFLPGAPFLAVSILAMDILAIYGLAAYGGKIARTA
jgi:hypothetical protein